LRFSGSHDPIAALVLCGAVRITQIVSWSLAGARLSTAFPTMSTFTIYGRSTPASSSGS
jgi:hypothetical protein